MRANGGSTPASLRARRVARQEGREARPDARRHPRGPGSASRNVVARLEYRGHRGDIGGMLETTQAVGRFDLARLLRTVFALRGGQRFGVFTDLADPSRA